MSAAVGEIVLEHASRSFSVRADRGTSLKELVLRRGGRGAPPVRALDDVSLRVCPGETVGVVGRNGAGKSSTLRVLAGIVPLHSGSVEVGGRIVSLLELGAGFGREFSGRENVELNGALHGLTRDQVAARMDEVLAFSELGEFVDAPVKTYSNGMLVRLGFSIAAHLDADVLLIDEVLAVGDEGFQRKCLRRIAERIAAGATLVLVSHDPGAIERVCERVVVLDGGRKVFDGPVSDGLLAYHRLMGTEHGGGESVRSGPTVVADVELVDGAGRARQVFRTGEALRVALRLADPRPDELELEVRDQTGHSVFRTRTQPAADRLVFEIERLALLGGDYDLVLGDRVVRFSVADEPGGEGVADLRGTWRAAQRAEAA
ncbi:MAG: lipopolysaccharide transport system ATP-binding protein [Solirubrobacteraceae bacterium]|nr:lipopolysaccharide transport system ATP-binding protein [Solirubrobacteraceae bacterium]